LRKYTIKRGSFIPAPGTVVLREKSRYSLSMLIRKTTLEDIDEVMTIYRDAQNFMKAHGNPLQWGNFYPTEALVRGDIAAGTSYVCTGGDRIAAVFVYRTGADETYARIYDGAWLSDDAYGVVHRIASAHSVKGAAAFCITWAFEQCGNLRIDTHADNVPMQRLLAKLGFISCGIIHTYDGSPRLAFQKRA